MLNNVVEPTALFFLLLPPQTVARLHSFSNYEVAERWLHNGDAAVVAVSGSWLKGSADKARRTSGV